jgi:hypothetical protein
VLTASVVVPTPPFGEKNEISRRLRTAEADATASSPGAATSMQQRVDAGAQLVRVERPGHDVVGSGVQQPNALFHVVRCGDAEQRGCGQRQLGAQVANGARCLGRSRQLVHQDQLRLRRA